MRGREHVVIGVVAIVVGLATGCGGDADEAEAGGTPVATEIASSTPLATESASPDTAVPMTPSELRAELVEMLEEDQAERTGNAAVWHDRERAERLAEIVNEHGWPGYSLVGEEGATAAWAIAQHADHDVAFQEEMLELMTAAVADGEADASQLAFLTDRVATNRDRPQVYGSQIRCVDGEAVPIPIEDEANVDERRAEVGLGSLAEYLAGFEEACAAEQ